MANPIDKGTQTLRILYNQTLTSKNENQAFYQIIPSGVYSGGDLSFVSDTITVQPLVAFLNDTTVGLKTGLRCETTTTYDLVSEATPTAPYICIRFDWVDSENNYMDILAKESGDLDDNDIILATATFSGSTLTGFDYSERSSYVIPEFYIDSGISLLDNILGDVDRSIQFASDAEILWNESEDEFNFNKDVNTTLKMDDSLVITRDNITYSNTTLVGSGLSIIGINGPALTTLNSTDVAFIDGVLEDLSTYRFNGSTWSLVGSGLSISGIGAPALTTLNSTDVAFLDNTLEELSTYRFNGSTWSLVGSGLSISGIGNLALTALNSTDVAFIDNNLEELRTYRFNGSTWSLVGSGLSISGAGYPALTTLNSTDVAFIDSTLEELRTYRFNGSTWSLVGSGLSISGAGIAALTALNSTDVAFIDVTLEELRTYRFSQIITW